MQMYGANVIQPHPEVLSRRESLEGCATSGARFAYPSRPIVDGRLRMRARVAAGASGPKKCWTTSRYSPHAPSKTFQRREVVISPPAARRPLRNGVGLCVIGGA